jgi:hypothetical protein
MSITDDTTRHAMASLDVICNKASMNDAYTIAYDCWASCATTIPYGTGIATLYTTGPPMPTLSGNSPSSTGRSPSTRPTDAL